MLLPLADRIAGHILDTIERTPPARRPFRHINFVDAFPADVYAVMLRALPDLPCTPQTT